MMGRCCKYAAGLLGLLLLVTSCGRRAAQIVVRPSFDGDSAYVYVEQQMAFGPRVPNSEAHTRCMLWLVERLRDFGADVTLQKGFMPDYSGRPQQVFNVIGRFVPPSNEGAEEPQNRPYILLCAHYDSRPWCDQEEEYGDRFYNVPGANDGASGVAVLLEIARQLKEKEVRVPVEIVFFDCEDMGTPHFYTGQQRENTWCLGSQLWAMEYANACNTQDAPRHYTFGILLDMVGAPDAVFPREYYSTRYAANYQERIWRSAADLGYGHLFTNNDSYPITDDHYYINQAGIPCVDIIHYDTRHGTGFASWWHTRHDDMSNISRATLQAVGEVVMSQL